MLATEGAASSIPLNVLTGFLGSGKTTLLAELLRNPRGERIAVLVNELGEIALDHHLLERIDEDLVALPSGCVCCTMRGELYESIERVVALRPTRIVLETTGLADPAPIVHGLASDPGLKQHVHLQGVLTVVDCERAEELIETQPEVRPQLDFADRIALTKADRAPLRVAAVRELLAAEAPGREVRETPHGRADPAWVLDGPPLARLAETLYARAWLHHGSGATECATHSVEVEDAADVELLQTWLRIVTAIDGPRLLRVKALVECRSTGGVFALQAAGHAVSPPRRLERPPAGFRGVRCVMIERGLGAAAGHLVESLHQAIAGSPLK